MSATVSGVRCTARTPASVLALPYTQAFGDHVDVAAAGPAGLVDAQARGAQQAHPDAKERDRVAGLLVWRSGSDAGSRLVWGDVVPYSREDPVIPGVRSGPRGLPALSACKSTHCLGADRRRRQLRQGHALVLQRATLVGRRVASVALGPERRGAVTDRVVVRPRRFAPATPAIAASAASICSSAR